MEINKLNFSNKLKKERVLYIDFLRFASMFMVFFHHVSSEFYLAKPWVSGIFGVGWGELGVYTFIILSGYSLYLNKNDELNFLQFIKKRFLNIIIPYWIFYLSFFLFYLFIKRFDFQFSNINQIFISLSGIDTLINPFFVISKYCLVDWFLGFIIILYLIAPFVFFIYNKNKYFCLIFFLFISCFAMLAYKNVLVLRIPVVQVFTFLVGIFAADCFYRNFGKGELFFSILLFFATYFILFFFENEKVLIHWLRSIYLSLSFVVFVKVIFSVVFFEKIIQFFELLIRFGSDISYIFFLCHHQILFLLKKIFIEKNEYFYDHSYLVLVVPLFLTVFVSCFFQFVYRSVVSLINK